MSNSFSQRQWYTSDEQDKQPQIRSLCREMKLSSAFAKILVNRDLYQCDEVERYLNPASQHCHNPFLMYDMQKAVKRIHSALQRRERVVIYGDYDVDGSLATVLLYRYFKRIGLRIHYFIPERLKDGYGMSETTLMTLKDKKTDLIITVDNGITAVSESRLLKQLGVDLIITDHHVVSSEIPIATAIINPQQPECPYPFKGLCGTGVAYKLLVAFEQYLTDLNYWDISGYIQPNLQRDLDLVAFATVSDRVPMIDENRYFVKKGLELLNSNPRPGFQVLIKECNVRYQVTPNVISFKLAPKINAVGRLSNPCTGVNLLLSHSQMEAKMYVGTMISLNLERQKIERRVLEDALNRASDQQNQKVIILVDEQWHSGVIGSVASKVAAQFQRPTIVLTLADDTFSGSIRSVKNIDVCSMLKRCEGYLNKFGGHKVAAGLSIKEGSLDAFCQQFRDIFESSSHLIPNDALMIEAWIDPLEWEAGLAEEIFKMFPFGTQNPEPIIGIKNTQLSNIKTFGNQHLKFHASITANSVMEMFAWGHLDWFDKLGGPFDLAVVPQTSNISENDSLKFNVVDIKPAS